MDLLLFLFSIAACIIVARGIYRAWFAPYVKTEEAEAEEVLEPVQEPVFDTGTGNAVPSVDFLHYDLTREEIIVLLARQKVVPVSANAIFGVVKGNKAEVLQLVKEAKGQREYYSDMQARIQREVHDVAVSEAINNGG